MGQLASLADAGDEQYLVRFDVEFDERFLEGIQNPEIAATRAPG
jgi:hypothetical protein